MSVDSYSGYSEASSSPFTSKTTSKIQYGCYDYTKGMENESSEERETTENAANCCFTSIHSRLFAKESFCDAKDHNHKIAIFVACKTDSKKLSKYENKRNHNSEELEDKNCLQQIQKTDAICNNYSKIYAMLFATKKFHDAKAISHHYTEILARILLDSARKNPFLRSKRKGHENSGLVEDDVATQTVQPIEIFCANNSKICPIIYSPKEIQNLPVLYCKDTKLLEKKIGFKRKTASIASRVCYSTFCSRDNSSQEVSTDENSCNNFTIKLEKNNCTKKLHKNFAISNHSSKNVSWIRYTSEVFGRKKRVAKAFLGTKSHFRRKSRL